MVDSDKLLSELRGRFLGFQQDTANKLVALYDEGLVSARDRLKLEYDMQATASALLDSMQSISCTDQFRLEWLNSIELSYRERITNHIRDIENRRYSDRANNLRIATIVEAALARIESPQRRLLVQAEVKWLASRLVSNIRGISRKHPRRPELIEAWIQEFEQEIGSLATDTEAESLVNLRRPK